MRMSRMSSLTDSGAREAFQSLAAKRQNVHQQTGLAAGAIANDDKLPADLSHDVVEWKEIEGLE